MRTADKAQAERLQGALAAIVPTTTVTDSTMTDDGQTESAGDQEETQTAAVIGRPRRSQIEVPWSKTHCIPSLLLCLL